MRYWTRTTHNFNNQTREWEFRKELEIEHPEYQSVLGVHALDSGRWMALIEIVNANLKYYQQYKDDADFVSLKLHGCTTDAVLHDLEKMEKIGIVMSKVI